MVRAAELLDLIKAPTSLATVILIGFALDQLKQHAHGYDASRNTWALVASSLALIITVTIVAVMTPLAYQVAVKNRGPVETRLLVYWLTFLVAIGTACYSAWIVTRVIREWQAQRMM